MPIYPVKHLETGETQELVMSVADYDQWRKDNPDWDKDWSKGCAAAQEVGDWQNKLISKHPSWKWSGRPRMKIRLLQRSNSW